MPIEITELVIKASVGDHSHAPSQGDAPVGAESSNASKAKLKTVERAVKEAVDILKRKNER